MDQLEKFESLEAEELTNVDGGLLLDNRVVIVTCTTRYPLPPGQIPWNPWIGAPYPTQF